MERGLSIPVFFEFKRILKKSDTGILKISFKNIRKEIGFKKGKISFAYSNSFDERLAVILNLLGFISESQFDHLSGFIFSNDTKLKEQLLNDHLVDKNELLEADEYRMRRIAITSFSILQGSWEFLKVENQDKFYNHLIPLDEIILSAGTRFEVYDYIRLLHRFNTPVAFGMNKIIDFALSMDELEIYDIIRSGEFNSNRDIISKKSFIPEFYWKHISVLFLLGLIKFERNQLREDIEGEIGRLLKLRTELEKNSNNWFSSLGIGEKSTPDEIEEVLHRSLIRFNPDNFGSATAPEIKKSAVYVTSFIKKYIKDQKVKAYEAEIPSFSDQAHSSPVPDSSASDEKSNVENLKEKAVNLYEKGHYDEAIPILKDMVKVNKKNFDLLLLLGKCQIHVQFFSDEAARNLSKAIEINPSNIDAIFSLGLLFKKTKKLSRAQKCFKRILELQPGHFMAKKELASIKSFSGKKIKKGFFKKRK